MLEPARRTEEAAPSPATPSAEPAGAPLLPLSVASIIALQRTAGNTSVTRLLQRDPTGIKEPDTGKGGPHAWDWSYKQKIGDRASLALKFSFAPTQHKAAVEGKVKTSGGGATASGGFWETKTAREHAGEHAATKVSATILKGAGSL